MNCGDICRRDVVVVRKEDGIRQIAELMREHEVGTVVVVKGEGNQRKPIGIMTDRDIVIRLLTNDIDLDAVRVGDVMCCDLVMVKEHDDLCAAIELMNNHHVRRVPVVDDQGHLKGIMSATDAMQHLADGMMSISKLRGGPGDQAVCCH